MVNSKTPKVTVFIPVYNREKYIGEAIESILAQTFSDFEILLVDDGSTDQSVDTIRSFSDLGFPKLETKVWSLLSDNIWPCSIVTTVPIPTALKNKSPF
jgi:GT2 family glycosyltransferase